jgi:hypothetical protein
MFENDSVGKKDILLLEAVRDPESAMTFRRI